MPHKIVVIIGSLPVEHLQLDRLVHPFGWSLEKTDRIDGLERLAANHDVAAALFNPGLLELPWQQALQSVLSATPKALPIICHDFAEKIDWQQAADAGAFHSLLFPFNLEEVQQCLGFVWAAKRRAVPMMMRRRQRSRSTDRSQSEDKVSGVVA